MIAGTDLSNNNPTADFEQLRRAGYRFCIHKCSEGVGFVDRYLPERWRQMKSARVARGCYHFARPSATGAAAEAEYFLACLKNITLEPGDGVWLDQEDDRVPVGVNLSAWTLDWLRRVERALGFTPGIYTYPSYITERGLTDPELARFPLWWASYSEPMRPAPPPWTEVAIWQYTSEGHPPGTSGDIDLNWLLSDDIDDFLALGMVGGSAGPYPTADEAFDAYLTKEGETPVWAGQVVGRGHWFGRDPQELCRSDAGCLLAYDGGYARDATALALDDWQVYCAEQLTVWGGEGG